MQPKEISLVDQPTIALLGMGKLGEWLFPRLKEAFESNVIALDIDENKTKHPLEEQSPAGVVKVLKDKNPEVAVLAITAGNQTTEGVQMVNDWLQSSSEGKKIVVNLNSVQSTVHEALKSTLGNIENLVQRDPIVLVSIHPYHRPSGFKEGVTYRWLLTDISVLGDESQKKEEIESGIKSQLSTFLKTLNTHEKDKNLSFELVDLTSGAQIDDQHLTGSELHDYIAASYQALFHMVKLIPNIQNTDWYKQNFVQVRASDDLSSSIVQGTSWAQHLQGTFLQRIGDNHDPDNILKVVQSLLLEADSNIPSQFHDLMTGNVRKLRDLYSPQ
jgi:prephenate dehydrogenase